MSDTNTIVDYIAESSYNQGQLILLDIILYSMKDCTSTEECVQVVLDAKDSVSNVTYN